MSTIVVGFDGTRHARAALSRAAVRAAEDEAAVVVVSPVRRRWDGRRLVVDPQDVRDGERRGDEARRVLFAAGVGARSVVGVGSPVLLLARAAEECGARLVVAGRPWRRPAALRAVSVGALQRRVGCPVEVVAG